MRFNDSQSLSPWPVSEAMADIVTTSLRIGAKTDGAMDITVGPLVNLWGFGPEQQPVQIPTQEQIDAMKAKTGLQHLTVINQLHQQYLQKDVPDLYVDLSTVGEGYAADHLARLMEQEGISRYLVSVGGALNSRGMNGEGQPWRVAIKNRPIKRMRFRPWSISMATGLAPPVAIATITSWTANACPMLSIRKPGVPSNIIWCP